MIMGNLTRDPEIRYTTKGTAIAELSLAINRTWTNDAGEKKEDVTFIECKAFGKTAETMGKFLKKGRPLFVEGRLDVEEWEDKETKKPRRRTVVIVEGFQFLGDKKD